MEKKIQSLLDKYEKISIDSIKFENNILDLEKSSIFEKESQIPNLVSNSSCPFDKNYCFYDIEVTGDIEENIFPKEKYYLKSQQTFELKPIDVNKIFDDEQLLGMNSVEDKKEAKEDENNVKNQIMSSIKNNNYKSYIPKSKNNLQNQNNMLYMNFPSENALSNQINNQWIILGKDIKEGPFNDYNMYRRLYKILFESKDKIFPNYIVNEKISDIFMTMEECFKRLKNKFESQYISNDSNSNQFINKFLLQNMRNMILYQNQLIQYNIMNRMILQNNLKNNNIMNYNNKQKSRNKFDNNNYQNNNFNNNIRNSKNENKNNFDDTYQNNRKQNYYNRGRNKFKNNNLHYNNNYGNNYNEKKIRNKDEKNIDKNDNHNQNKNKEQDSQNSELEKVNNDNNQNQKEKDNSQNNETKNFDKDTNENKIKMDLNDFFK